MANDLNGEWTKSPNWLYDVFKNNICTLNEVRVLMAINREQFGFQNKDGFRGTIGKLSTLSGVSWLNTREAVESLHNKGFITKSSLIKTSSIKTSKVVLLRLVLLRPSNSLIKTSRRRNKLNGDKGIRERKENIYKEKYLKDNYKEVVVVPEIKEEPEPEIDIKLITEKLKNSKWMNIYNYMDFSQVIYSCGQEAFIQAIGIIDSKKQLPVVHKRKLRPYFEGIVKRIAREIELGHDGPMEKKDNHLDKLWNRIKLKYTEIQSFKDDLDMNLESLPQKTVNQLHKTVIEIKRQKPSYFLVNLNGNILQSTYQAFMSFEAVLQGEMPKHDQCRKMLGELLRIEQTIDIYRTEVRKV